MIKDWWAAASNKIKKYWEVSLPYIDRVAWVAFPPYGFYIGIRHVKEHWEEYRDLAESYALILAERQGYSDDEQAEMLQRMKKSRYKDDEETRGGD